MLAVAYNRISSDDSTVQQTTAEVGRIRMVMAGNGYGLLSTCPWGRA